VDLTTVSCEGRGTEEAKQEETKSRATGDLTETSTCRDGNYRVSEKADRGKHQELPGRGGAPTNERKQKLAI